MRAGVRTRENTLSSSVKVDRKFPYRIRITGIKIENKIDRKVK